MMHTYQASVRAKVNGRSQVIKTEIKVHDKTVDTYLLAGTDKRKSRWDGRTHTSIDSLSWSVFGRRQQVTTLLLWWCGQFFTYHLPHGIDH